MRMCANRPIASEHVNENENCSSTKTKLFSIHYNTNYFNNDCCFDILNHFWIGNRWRTPFLTNVFLLKPQKHAETLSTIQ